MIHLKKRKEREVVTIEYILTKVNLGEIGMMSMYRSCYLTCTRLDIAYGVDLVSRYRRTKINTLERHKRIFRYSKGKIHLDCSIL